MSSKIKNKLLSVQIGKEKGYSISSNVNIRYYINTDNINLTPYLLYYKNIISLDKQIKKHPRKKGGLRESKKTKFVSKRRMISTHLDLKEGVSSLLLVICNNKKIYLVHSLYYKHHRIYIQETGKRYVNY